MMKKTIEVDVQQLLDTAPIEEELETFEYVLPELRLTHQEEARRDLPEIIGEPQGKEEILVKFELLDLILDAVENIDALAAKVDETYQSELERYEENMQAVFTQTKPFEKTARSLYLLYQNATGDTNVYIMPVSSARFADSANPKHFEEFRHFLREKFKKWMMDDSPFYISYIGDVGSKSAMDNLAMIAQETRAMAVVDIKEFSTAQAAKDYAARLKIAGIPAHLAHLVTMGTWVYVNNAFDVEFIRDAQDRLKRVERKMAVPSAGAFIGKMMSVPPGYYVTGLEQSAILGIDGVKAAYDLERDDAKDYYELGLIQIEPYGHIMGVGTANKSNNYDLRKFPKVDVSNSLLKDLVQFCNNKAFSKWGNKQKREFKREIETYLNNRIKHEVIEGYNIGKIEYDEYDEVVDIEIAVKFYEAVDEFSIDLHGPRAGIDIVIPEEDE